MAFALAPGRSCYRVTLHVFDVPASLVKDTEAQRNLAPLIKANMQHLVYTGHDICFVGSAPQDETDERDALKFHCFFDTKADADAVIQHYAPANRVTVYVAGIGGPVVRVESKSHVHRVSAEGHEQA